jgi:DNA processing protein
MDQERLSFLALYFIPGIGPVLLKQLISYCGSATEVFRQPKHKLVRIPGVGDITADAIRSGLSLRQAEQEAAKAERNDAQILLYTDAAYPSRLKSIEDAPALLYVQGTLNFNHPRSIGIVGTRKATSYGKAIVETLVKELVPHQPHIISGLAYGIDIQAHKEALKNGLATVAVLGSGLDIIYPAPHTDTARRMINQGALITENPFGTSPDAHNFPQRNRIIAGLCDALIVVEAGDRGGALITAEIANSYNRDVFAVPGGLQQPWSVGCNQLIKTNKANLLTSVKDLEYIMNWTKDQLEKAAQLSLELDDLDEEERHILGLMKEKKRTLSIDELSFISQQPQGKLSSVLLSLEFKNRVSSLPGKRYTLKYGR